MQWQYSTNSEQYAACSRSPLYIVRAASSCDRAWINRWGKVVIIDLECGPPRPYCTRFFHYLLSVTQQQKVVMGLSGCQGQRSKLRSFTTCRRFNKKLCDNKWSYCVGSVHSPLSCVMYSTMSESAYLLTCLLLNLGQCFWHPHTHTHTWHIVTVYWTEPAS